MAEFSNMMLHNKYLADYESSMQNISNNVQSYFNSSELETIHEEIKNYSLNQVRSD